MRINRCFKIFFLLAAVLCCFGAEFAWTGEGQDILLCAQSRPATMQHSFEVASIRPVAPGAIVNMGFRSLPGGRIEIGGIGVRWLISIAFHIPLSQIRGGPLWLSTDTYAISAIPPQDSLSANAKLESWTPTEEQRLMLQQLLADRFSLRVHSVTVRGPMYVLTRGSGPLRLNPPKDTNRSTAFALFGRGNLYDGEMHGRNISMPEVAAQLSALLDLPVIDKTGITGEYDFAVEPFTDNNESADVAAVGALQRLGLRLRRGKGDIQTLVIDNIQRPTPN